LVGLNTNPKELSPPDPVTMPPPAPEKAAIAAERLKIAVESGVTALPMLGGSFRSHPEQVMSEATKIALQWAVSIGVVVNAALRGSTTVMGNWAALLAAV